MAELLGRKGTELLKMNEAKKVLRCSLSKIQKLSAAGEIPRYRIGGQVFFRREDLMAYIESCRIEAREPITV